MTSNTRFWIATLAIACSLAACGGSAHTSAPTTKKPTSTTTAAPAVTATPATTIVPRPPTPSTIAAVKAYLAGPGAPLITFERATSALDTATVPSTATCLHLINVVLPNITKGPKELQALTVGIRDPTLVDYFHTDVANKNLLLQACKKYTLPKNAQGLQGIQTQWMRLHDRLLLFGITI